MRVFTQGITAYLLFSLAPTWAKIGIEHQMDLGNPSEATTDTNNKNNFLIQREEFAESYNNERGEPNWVSWCLSAQDTGSSGRSKDFFMDTSLPDGFTKVTIDIFPGFDRGHMCPSGDRTLSRAHNDKTFLMSNMIPQAADNNRGPWEKFESYCRDLALKGKEIEIVCGPSGFGKSRFCRGVAVPDYTWKIAVAHTPGGTITSSSRTIAVKMPNTNGILNNSWTDYITNVDQIERDTGYRFFRNLNTSTASTLRAAVDKEFKGKPPEIAPTKDGVLPPVAHSKQPPEPPVIHTMACEEPKGSNPIPPSPPLPDGPRVIVLQRKDGATYSKEVQSTVTKGAVTEIRGMGGDLLVVNSQLLLANLPLVSERGNRPTREQIQQVISQYDEVGKNERIRSLVALQRAAWIALQEHLAPPP